MRFTLGNLKDDGMAQRLGMTPCDPSFVNLINRAQDDLMNAGRWWMTYQRMKICALNNCITWPPQVKNIEALSVCQETIPIRNMWFEFQQYVRPPATGCQDYCGIDQLLDRGTSPVFDDIVGLNKKLRLYCASSTDYGKRVLLEGYDENGTKIRTLDSVTGVWVDGEYVTLAAPFVTTSNLFKQITGLQKPVTNSTVSLYEFDVDESTERLIGFYSSWEQNPAYRRSYLTKELCSACAVVNAETDGCSRVPCGRPILTCLARLEFIPAVNDPDWLMIGNLSVIESAAQALLLKQKQDWQGYNLMWKDAIGSMRQWSEANSGQRELTVISQPVYGSANFERVVGGFL